MSNDDMPYYKERKKTINYDEPYYCVSNFYFSRYHKTYYFYDLEKECTVIYGSWIYIKGKPVYALLLNNDKWVCGIQVYASDYGKTWALTKEELE